METKHEQKICPLCKEIFECKVGNITECQCFNIHFEREERNWIEQKYKYDCLCVKCLVSIKEEFVRYKALNSAQ